MNDFTKYNRSKYTTIGKSVGKGTYGTVFKAKCDTTGTIVALKKINMYDAEDEGIPATALREISVLRELKHSKIVNLIGIEHSEKLLTLVFEWMDMDLHKYMETCGTNSMKVSVIKSFMFQILNGLKECHSHGIMHRDLKPQNLLVNKQGFLKIADFGLARAFQIPIRKYTPEVSTLWYRAPEILLGQREYACPIDMWSVGTIFVEMLNRQPLWPGDSQIDQLYKIFRTLGTPVEKTWPGVSRLPDYKQTFPKWPKSSLKKIVGKLDKQGVNLLQQIFLYEPTTRITAIDALRHPWFDDNAKIAQESMLNEKMKHAINIDAEDESNPQMCTKYANEIYLHYREKEGKLYHVPSFYLSEYS